MVGFTCCGTKSQVSDAREVRPEMMKVISRTAEKKTKNERKRYELLRETIWRAENILSIALP